MFTFLMILVLVGAVLIAGILMGAAIALGARQEKELIQQSAAVSALPARPVAHAIDTRSAHEQSRRAA